MMKMHAGQAAAKLPGFLPEDGRQAHSRFHVFPRGPMCSMQRVLLNLVLNAARAIRQPHGAIEIGVAGMTSADGHGAQFVRLTVADNGAGMDGSTVSDLRQNLTETSDMAPGTGLGLRMVHQTVHAHGGRLQFDSQPGTGTTVRIDLPAVVQQ